MKLFHRLAVTQAGGKFSHTRGKLNWWQERRTCWRSVRCVKLMFCRVVVMPSSESSLASSNLLACLPSPNRLCLKVTLMLCPCPDCLVHSKWFVSLLVCSLKDCESIHCSHHDQERLFLSLKDKVGAESALATPHRDTEDHKLIFHRTSFNQGSLAFSFHVA